MQPGYAPIEEPTAIQLHPMLGATVAVVVAKRAVDFSIEDGGGNENEEFGADGKDAGPKAAIMALALVLLLSLVATVVAVGGRALVNDPITFRKNVILINGQSDVRHFSDMAGLFMPATYCKTEASDDATCATYHGASGDFFCDYTQTAHGTKICRQTVSSKTGMCYCGTLDDDDRKDDDDNGKDDDDDDDDDDAGNGNEQNFNGTQTYNYTRWIPQPPPGGWGGSGGGWAWGQPAEPIRVPENSTPCKTSCDTACAYSGQYCCEASATGTCDITQIDDVCYCGGAN